LRQRKRGIGCRRNLVGIRCNAYRHYPSPAPYRPCGGVFRR
jgi:hypothetical protein